MDDIAPVVDEQADNRLPIQQAIDEAHARGGGTVVLPSGRWPVGGPLVLRDHVTVRGTGILVTTICPLGEPTSLVVGPDGPLSGATLEDLAISGLTRAGTGAAGDAGAAGVDLAHGASFCVLRRLRLTDLPGPAVRLTGDQLDHLYLEQLVVERCGGDGIVFDPTGTSSAVFLTEISIRDFGTAVPKRAGLRLRGRALVSQLHVQPVRAGAVGLKLEPGSDHTVASNLFFGVDGGAGRDQTVGVVGVQVETELIRDLGDAELARTFP